MGIFSKDKAPALTRSARKISDEIACLDENGRKRASATVAALVVGIRNMGALPESVTDELWTVLVTIAGKALAGGKSEIMFDQLRAGCSAELLELITSEAKR